MQSRTGDMTRAGAKGVARPAGLCSFSLASHVSLRQEVQQPHSARAALSPSLCGWWMCLQVWSQGSAQEYRGCGASRRSRVGMAGAEARVGCDGAGR